MNKKILIVAAHPDDEVLGCGGTILKHVADGDSVHIVIMAEGITSRDSVRDIVKNTSLLEKLHSQSYMVAKRLGAQSLTMFRFPDNRMDSVNLLDIIKKIEQVVDNVKPDVIYTHHGGDINIDHQITNKTVITASRALPGKSVKQILFFETLSSTDYQLIDRNNIFVPNWFVDIENEINNKIEILKIYDSEMREYPHSRSYEGVKLLAQYRGLAVGHKYIEAFSIGRNIL